ncbi:Panacea domain-containing protein [Teredinibacter franksiae]|uniref:Panacea domain-containing protein n=1 Tax=Teredinibacter franksiae TaxID=2761453 RepID=UPI001624DD40|nr:Panacea domain-containing protein [Teredinibacter franksiae]
MKTVISNIIKYLLKEYPHKSELSASRLTKMIYLMDWKSSIDSGHQITNAQWHFDHYGPYVEDFVKLAKEDKDISVENTSNYYGGKKQLFKLKKKFEGSFDLTKEQKDIANFVIDATKKKNYEDFIQLVYSTYPVISNDRYSHLDLVGSAEKYKELLANNSTKALYRTSQ